MIVINASFITDVTVLCMSGHVLARILAIVMTRAREIKNHLKIDDQILKRLMAYPTIKFALIFYFKILLSYQSNKFP